MNCDAKNHARCVTAQKGRQNAAGAAGAAIARRDFTAQKKTLRLDRHERSCKVPASRWAAACLALGTLACAAQLGAKAPIRNNLAISPVFVAASRVAHRSLAPANYLFAPCYRRRILAELAKAPIRNNLAISPVFVAASRVAHRSLAPASSLFAPCYRQRILAELAKLFLIGP